MNINPKSDVLIVKEIERPHRTEAGLYIPPTVNNADNVVKGKVLRAGPGKVNAQGSEIPHGFEAGDTIAFEKRRGLPVTYEGGQYIFINASEVFGTVEEIQ